MTQASRHAVGGGFVRRLGVRSLLRAAVVVSVGAAVLTPLPGTAQPAAASIADTGSGSTAGGRLVLAQAGGYGDIAGDAYYSDAVATLTAQGVFAGTECRQGFCPGDAIDRKTMAVWTVRVLDGQDPPAIAQTRFDDVDASGFHSPFIERMAELGVTTGCGDGSGFCPDRTVTRSQMAVFLSRAYSLEPGPDPGFGDVASDAWYYDDVARLAHSGITSGCGDGTNYCPSRATTRAQMAVFLWHAEQRSDDAPDGAATFKALAVGGAHNCAIVTDDTITCWGANDYGQNITPAGTYRAVTVGGGHGTSCAIATDDTITCWGRNWRGATEAPSGTYKTVAVSDWLHSCAIATDDTITCWGNPGDAKTDAPSGTYKTLAVASQHNCAIATDDTITCWGDNLNGRADAPSGTYKALASANTYNCAIATDDTITCWGSYCGTGTDGRYGCWWMNRGPSGTYKTLAAASSHSCAIATNNTITCWGNNEHGQADPPSGTYKTLAAASSHSCAIATNNTITCWGNNEHGQADPPSGTYKTVTAASSHSCAIATNNTITCWGNNEHGQADPPRTDLEVSATQPLAPLDLSPSSTASHISEDVLDFDMIDVSTGATVNLRRVVHGRTPLLLWLYSPY